MSIENEDDAAVLAIATLAHKKRVNDRHLATLVTNIMRQDYDGDLKNWLAAMKDYCLAEGLVKGGDA